MSNGRSSSRKRKNHDTNDAKRSPAASGSATSSPRCNGWIWWSAAPNAPRQPPKDHFDKKIPADIRKEFFELMRLYRDAPDKLLVGKHRKFLVDGIWELIIRRHNNPYRLLYWQWGDRAIALDVFFKNQRKTPTDVAQDRKRQWLATRGEPPQA